MVPTFNDEDIIEEVISHLISQGLELVVLDNGSTDKTYEICKKFEDNGIVELRQYHSSSTRVHDLPIMFGMLYDMALTHSPDWVIRSDSDEILESGQRNQTLKQAIINADSDGYNLIQFDRFDFFMTDDDDENANSLKEKLKYYSHYGDFIYRAWKYYPGISVSDAGGHYPIFPDGIKYQIAKKKFVLRHYPLRSKKQTEKKLEDRMKGINENNKNNEELQENINKIKILSPEKVDHNLLTRYENEQEWNYELKYCPLLKDPPPKRDQIFSKDGFLLRPHKSNYELSLEVRNLRGRLFERKIQKSVAFGKRIFKKNKNK
jgi:glycosyltransferase involved in cell wall biosynthesis